MTRARDRLRGQSLKREPPPQEGALLGRAVERPQVDDERTERTKQTKQDFQGFPGQMPMMSPFGPTNLAGQELQPMLERQAQRPGHQVFTNDAYQAQAFRMSSESPERYYADQGSPATRVFQSPSQQNFSQERGTGGFVQEAGCRSWDSLVIGEQQYVATVFASANLTSVENIRESPDGFILAQVGGPNGPIHTFSKQNWSVARVRGKFSNQRETVPRGSAHQGLSLSARMGGQRVPGG